MCAVLSSYVLLYGTVDRTKWQEAGISDDVFFICIKKRVVFDYPVILVRTKKKRWVHKGADDLWSSECSYP